MPSHRGESPYFRVAEALRDAAFVLEHVMVQVGSVGVFITEDVGANRRSVVHFYPRTPEEVVAVKSAVRQARWEWLGEDREKAWETEKLIAPVETQPFGRYLELSIDPKGVPCKQAG